MICSSSSRSPVRAPGFVIETLQVRLIPPASMPCLERGILAQPGKKAA